ncbi:PTS sugar transporter subunit IIB [Fervidibacillus halotolerans]|uniref:PTS sugar transporter subunit IIB n=1 Tax=Fervidibacillus halotolerans TaxID=2980027 RepID=A0A9E8RYW7_9BACI|nr:PTS sugar transporter subunit IIB [Fervidibacillus halotolerans]WAA12693.1 PTS sugar transporter subunit IIB [Fervidibacillus halotolerans]
MKKIIVACGSGVATSQTVASKIQSLLRDRNIQAQVEAVDIKSLDTHIRSSVAYVAITNPEKEYPIPVINGIAFLTGIGMEEELEKIIQALK